VFPEDLPGMPLDWDVEFTIELQPVLHLSPDGYTRFHPMSYPIFMPKSSTHHMYAQDQLFHTYRQKVLTDNQMS
jgi:hypothetical protein